MINFKSLSEAKLETKHFPFLSAQLIPQEVAVPLCGKFPQISKYGHSMPSERVVTPIEFDLLLSQLKGVWFRKAISDKFDEDLSECEIFLRWNSHSFEGKNRLHVDRQNRFITMLLYFNEPSWECCEKAPLRLHYKQGEGFPVFKEVKPTAGMLVAFRTTGDDWHSTPDFNGKRQVLLINYQKPGLPAKF